MSTIFPTTYSTLSPPALGQFISEKYNFNVTNCKLLVRGVGDTYEVETADKRYILRVYRSSHRSLPQIEAEIALLLALKQAKVSVSYPILDVGSNPIKLLNAAEGIRHAVLFSYAAGQVQMVLNEPQLKNLGHEIAAFHNVSSSINLNNSRWEFNVETTLLQPLAILKPFYADDKEGYEWLQNAVQTVIAKLSEYDTSRFSVGYCHFDFLAKNFHFDKDNVTFFDFDFMGKGWLANDIMSFWQHLCLDVFHGKTTQEMADASYQVFINAYKEKRPLHEEELKAVPYLSLGFWLFYMAFHTTHDQFYPYVQPAHLKLRTGLVKHLMERYWV